MAEAQGTGTVEVQVARDRGFRKVVARELIKTTDKTIHAAKARVTGLDPYEQYYYRFATRDEVSQVGRFRTALPPDSNQPVRFAFFSCQDYTFGYFNAHAALAEEDIDFVVNLGDYIYAEAYHSAGSPTGGDRTDPVGVLSLARPVPRQVRHLPLGRAPPEDAPAVPDDLHLGRPRGTGQLRRRAVRRRARPRLAYSVARRNAAYKAYFESMPTFGAKRGTRRIYGGKRFGRNVDLLMLDQRQYRDNQPCGDPFLGPACDELATRASTWARAR